MLDQVGGELAAAVAEQVAGTVCVSRRTSSTRSPVMSDAFNSSGSTTDVRRRIFGMLFTRSANSPVVFDQIAERAS
jgi:hypothetical protein